MQIFNPNLYPGNGGWYFVDSNGTKHVGSSFNALVNTVTAYRQRNGFPMGDPHGEITAQLCARQPGFCRDSDQGVVPPLPRHAHLTQRIVSWVGSWVQEKRFGRLKRVSDEEARRRAGICATCPRQIGIPMTCSDCAENLARMRLAILDGQQPVHKGLQTCDVFLDDLQVIVHHESGTSPAAPVWCWRKA